MMHDDGDDNEPENSHPPLSPATGAESLFLAGLATSNISANALAYQLRRNQFSSDRSSAYSVATDDFASAVGNPDDLTLLDDDEDNFSLQKNSPILELETDSESESHEEATSRGIATMAKTSKAASTTTKTTTPVAVPEPVKKPAVEEPAPAVTADTAAATPAADGPEVASHVYEHVKGAWAWGKGVPVFSPFMGIAEGVAGKVLEVAGTNLQEVDGNIKPQLSNLDTSLLNPAIATLVEVILGAAGKTEDVVKPIIITLLNPFGLIKNSPENPEDTEATASK